MMIIYSEDKVNRQSAFTKRVLDNDSREISIRQVNIPLYQAEKDEFTCFVLYDDHMRVISNVYEFLNFEMRDQPLTSRSKAAYALRLLHCFLALSGIDITGLGEQEFREFLYFLRGINNNPQAYSIRTRRSAVTVNGYLSVYRSFFAKTGIQCKAIFRSHSVTTELLAEGEHVSEIERKRYDSNLQIGTLNKDVMPKYIEPSDFRKLYGMAVKKQDKTAMILMHLMYGYGLRLGECLGLTLEDIQETRNNGHLMPALYLRNRLSDKKYQYAKGLMHPTDASQYRSRDYQLSRWRIVITYQLYERILEFIEATHSFAMDKYPDNYSKGVADTVSSEGETDKNHYVFLNRYGRVLSDQTWNKSLKAYFEEAGLPVDHDGRESNLSHRFRHGFAMFHARFSERPLNSIPLSKLMRHRSVSSTMIYYNPTPEDEFKLKTEFQEELYGLIPELKEGFDETLHKLH